MVEQLANGRTRQFLTGLARAFGGAILFALPMFLTMEMWQLGTYLNRWHLALLILLNLPLLVGLSHYSGFEPTFELKEDALDAFVAYAVACTTSAVILLLMGIIRFDMATEEIIGKIAIQTMPASIGALLAQSQFGGATNADKRLKEDSVEPQSSYTGELFLMLAGALFLGLNVAPTEEVMLVTFRLSEWQAILIVIFSLIAMHAFVYVVHFHGQETMPQDTAPGSVFLRFTIVGYMLVMLVSFYLLWTFGRTNWMPPDQLIIMIIVLGFPCSLGAAAARLIL